MSESRTPDRPHRLSPKWAARIDALLPFLDRFTAPEFQAGEWRGDAGELRSFEMSPAVSEFVQGLYDAGWIDDTFDWPSWESEAQTYLDPVRVANADPQTIRQLLTTHARKERFSEGHLVEMVTRGHIAAVLRRLQELRGARKAAR